MKKIILLFKCACRVIKRSGEPSGEPSGEAIVGRSPADRRVRFAHPIQWSHFSEQFSLSVHRSYTEMVSGRPRWIIFAQVMDVPTEQQCGRRFFWCVCSLACFGTPPSVDDEFIPPDIDSTPCERLCFCWWPGGHNSDGMGGHNSDGTGDHISDWTGGHHSDGVGSFHKVFVYQQHQTKIFPPTHRFNKPLTPIKYPLRGVYVPVNIFSTLVFPQFLGSF